MPKLSTPPPPEKKTNKFPVSTLIVYFFVMFFSPFSNIEKLFKNYNHHFVVTPNFTIKCEQPNLKISLCAENIAKKL